MGNFLDKSGLTRFKEKLLDEVDSRISNSSGGDSPTKEEIIEGATRVSDVEVNPSVATIEALQTGLARVESNLGAKMDNSTVHIVEKWSNGTQWYRKYSDGWIEQGGYLAHSATTHNLNFNTPFTNTNYTLTFGMSAKATSNYYNLVLVSKATSYASISYDSTASKYLGYCWYACGY